MSILMASHKVVETERINKLYFVSTKTFSLPVNTLTLNKTTVFLNQNKCSCLKITNRGTLELNECLWCTSPALGCQQTKTYYW